MFYIACFQYIPHTAPANRIMAYVKALSELGVEATVVFFLPDKLHSRVTEEYQHIRFRYLWESCLIDLPRLRMLSLRYYIWRFVRSLRPGDKTLVYAFPDLVVALAGRPDIEVFSETTEHPEVSFPAFLRGTTLERYLWACRCNAGIIVISQALRDYFVENGCEPGRVQIVNMMVDSTRFGKVQTDAEEKYIAYCGTASNNKDGVDQLIIAFATVVSTHPQYKLYIIGSTPSKTQRFGNYDLVKSLGIEENVVFWGIATATEMPRLLQSAEILALDRPDNKQARYGFPTKLGEYLFTGNPVVVTRVGEIPLFLKDGESALIAAPDNPQDFAGKLCWAIEHPEEAKKIGERGRRVAEEHFNYLTETTKLVRIINPA